MFQKTLYHVVRGREDLLIFEFADHTHEQEIRKNIEDALEIAKSANAAKSSSLSNMSHDIRTPMNVIVGLSNLMEHELDNPQKMREYIQKIQTSSNHLLGLINDVLDMSKIESGENRMNIETFDLTEQIREIDMLIYAKYRFVITDNGIGMKKEYLEHIFEPFSRQENSVTNRVQGTGLGMAITKNIVDMMSGIIQVESEEGKGSTFEVIFEFRIDKEKEKSSPAQPRKNEINSGESDILKGKRFLCAEDKELNAEILKALLEMEGAECEICTNGEEIVERFADVREGEFDAILMDVQMPLMNGYEAARAIRPGTNPLGRTIPVIAMTANVFADDIQQSLAAGMNAHISKPMDMGVLRKTVVKVISETPQTPMVVRIAGTKVIPKPRR
jgi:CheY-like chemotaxis protein